MIVKVTLFLVALVVGNSLSNPIVPLQELDAVANSINGFALKFMKQQDYATKNVFFSPLSIAAALGMVLGGARGQTAQEILKALQMPETISDQHIHNAMKQILSSEESKKRNNLTLELAQLVALQKSFEAKQTFTQLVSDKYEAVFKRVDFAEESQNATDEINEYVNQKTHGLIKKVFDKPLSPLTKFVLVNTLYFKGIFEDQFDKYFTHKEDFINYDKSKSKVDMMHKKSYLNVASDEKQLMVELPYVGNFSLYVILPKETHGLQSVIQDLTPDKIENLTSSLKSDEYKLWMPKFEYEFEPQLKESLEKLGVKSMFNESVADLSGISSAKLSISKAVHRAKIMMKEGGTEAAAVTEFVEISAKAFGKSGRVVPIIWIGHPFAFLIKDKTNNVIIFAGAVNKL